MALSFRTWRSRLAIRKGALSFQIGNQSLIFLWRVCMFTGTNWSIRPEILTRSIYRRPLRINHWEKDHIQSVSRALTRLHLSVFPSFVAWHSVSLLYLIYELWQYLLIHLSLSSSIISDRILWLGLTEWSVSISLCLRRLISVFPVLEYTIRSLINASYLSYVCQEQSHAKSHFPFKTVWYHMFCNK